MEYPNTNDAARGKWIIDGRVKKWWVGRLVVVEWVVVGGGGKVSRWHGVVEKVNPVEVRYLENPKNTFPFPNNTIHYRNVWLERSPVAQKPSTSTEELKLRRQVRKWAHVGGSVMLRYSKNGTVMRDIATVVSKQVSTCTIKTSSGKVVPFPPIVHYIKIEKVRFGVAPCPRSTVSGIKRYRRLEYVAGEAVTESANVIAHNELAHDKLEELSSVMKSVGYIYGSFNVRTVTDTTRLVALRGIMEVRKIKVLALQETRRNPNSEVVESLFESYSVSGVGGVGLLVCKELLKYVVKPTIIVPGRAIAVEILGTTFVSVYAPTCVNFDERENFFETLGAWISTTPTRKRLVLMGDFNARYANQVTSNHTRMATQQFEDFLSMHSLTIPQGRFSKDEQTRCTHKKVTLDYLVVRVSRKREMKNYTTIKAPLYSDHRMLLGLFKAQFRWPSKEKKEEQHVPDYALLRDKFIRSRFMYTFKGIKNCSYLEFVQLVKAASTELPAKEKVPARAPFDVQLYNDLFKMQCATRCDEDRLLNAIDSFTDSDTNRIIRQYTVWLEENPRLAWQHIKSLSAKNRKVMPGTVAERLSKFHSHFQTLFSSAHAPTNDPIDIFPTRAPDPRLVFDPGPFTLNELKVALIHSSNGDIHGSTTRSLVSTNLSYSFVM